MTKLETKITESFDIAIVGGGMVGLSLALLLTTRHPSWKVLVVEAFNPASTNKTPLNYRPSFDARSTALSQSSREIFEQMGLWQMLSEQVAPISAVHVSDKGHVGSTKMSAVEQQLEALGCVIENPWLGTVLMSAVEAQENIELAAPAELETLCFDDAGVSFTLTGQEGSFRAKLLVVADGAESKTRKRLGIGVRVKDYGKVGLIANISLEKPHQGVAYERFTDWGPMAMLPLTDMEGEHRSALVWTLLPEKAAELQAADEPRFLAELQQRFGFRLGMLKRAGQRFSYPLKQLVATEQVRRNLVVIGNAAHALHPVAGQGFNLSLRDAAMLAAVLAEASEQGQALGELEVLERYQQYQQADQKQTMVLSDFLPTVFGSKAAPVALARNMGLLALDALPSLRHQFTRVGMGLQTRGVK